MHHGQPINVSKHPTSDHLSKTPRRGNVSPRKKKKKNASSRRGRRRFNPLTHYLPTRHIALIADSFASWSEMFFLLFPSHARCTFRSIQTSIVDRKIETRIGKVTIHYFISFFFHVNVVIKFSPSENSAFRRFVPLY